MDAPLRVLSVASEMVPLVKTGGLADVAGALPAALAPLGVTVRTLLPGYPAVLAALTDVHVVRNWASWFGAPARLVAARHGAFDLFVLDAPQLYTRPGNPYVDANGRDWPDTAERFAALAAAAAAIGRGVIADFVPDVIHAHDWQTALVPVYLHFEADARRPATVLTIHNLAFQGRFGADVMERIGLPPEAFTSEMLEYHGDVGYLKAGLLLADAITTVSPTYAREIRTVEGGMGLDAILRHRGEALVGIVNGIDATVWDPATDRHLASTYDAEGLAARLANKRAVEARFGLRDGDGPLVCMITRLTEQKGIDLVVDALDDLVALGVRLVVLGTGDAAFEAALREGQARHPDHLAVLTTYDDALAHLMQGGCDAILIPSRFEPCGLTQLYGLRYGCVPIVARTGGLADTVVDANDAAMRVGVGTGFQFTAGSATSLRSALGRMVDAYRMPDTWRAIQRRGMTAEVDGRRQHRRSWRCIGGWSWVGVLPASIVGDLDEGPKARPSPSEARHVLHGRLPRRRRVQSSNRIAERSLALRLMPALPGGYRVQEPGSRQDSRERDRTDAWRIEFEGGRRHATRDLRILEAAIDRLRA